MNFLHISLILILFSFSLALISESHIQNDVLKYKKQVKASLRKVVKTKDDLKGQLISKYPGKFFYFIFIQKS